MIMVLNWMSSMARKASGTWSSESVEAMSAAALCFCNTGGVTPSVRQSAGWLDSQSVSQTDKQVNSQVESQLESQSNRMESRLDSQAVRHTDRQTWNLKLSHPKSPESKDDDDEVDDVGEEHERIDVSGSLILRVEDTPEEKLGWMVNAVET